MRTHQIELWSLELDEYSLFSNKTWKARLGFAVQIKSLKVLGRFQDNSTELPEDVLDHLAEQVGRPISDLDAYDWLGRTGRRHRTEILSLMGVKRPTKVERKALSDWLMLDVLPRGGTFSFCYEQACRWLIDRNLYENSQNELEKLIRSVRRQFEDGFLNTVATSLGRHTRTALLDSIEHPDASTGFASMKKDTGHAALENVIQATIRLKFIRSLGLSAEIFAAGGNTFSRRMRRRVGQEAAWEMRRHPEGR